jgi:hypothetical protein
MVAMTIFFMDVLRLFAPVSRREEELSRRDFCGRVAAAKASFSAQYFRRPRLLPFGRAGIRRQATPNQDDT